MTNFTRSNLFNVNTTKEKRNPYLSKWHTLFDHTTDHWISCAPKIGKVIYPCFSCRDMFAHRNSFLDHINRRTMIVKYYCPHCEQYMTYYNTCTFLMHCRNHFAEQGGNIDLEHLDISTVSMDVAGFLPHPDYPRIFDIEETAPNYSLNINVKFYKPKRECVGTRIVFFEGNELVFYITNKTVNGQNETQAMRLCQICTDMPKCEFVPLLTVHMTTNAGTNQLRCVNNNITKNNSIVEPEKCVTPPVNNIVTTNGVTPTSPSTNGTPMDISDENNSQRLSTSDEITEENDLSDSVSETQDTESLLVPQAEIIQVKNMKNLLRNPVSENTFLIPPSEIKKEIVPHCLECGKEQPACMKEHFQDQDRPINDDIKCNICFLILPTVCALRAHSRIHSKIEPFVCPECGKNFEQWLHLYTHMEDVCFHLAKNVRYKCPAKKCGKIFAQKITFCAHFPNAHLARKIVCDICGLTVCTDIEFHLHNKTHDNTAIPIPNLECVICFESVENAEEHAKCHCYNPDNRIYVYTCKYCKSYYRSKQTYAQHLLRCAKLLLNSQVKREAVGEKTDVQCKVLRYCKRCDSKIQFHCQYKDVKTVGKNCPQCGSVFGTSPEEIKTLSFTMSSAPKPKQITKRFTSEKYLCILCGKEVVISTQHYCKYANPHIVLKRIDGASSVQSSSPELSEEVVKKKRKRISPSSKNKKQHIEEIDQLPPVQPIIFNGEYVCNICDYRSKERIEFHEHIQKHRDVSTAYQCMECGECFVVKPSLIKHLQVFHLIENVESYINENECFDKEAVRELQENMRMMPGQSKEPVAENQCRICREQFSNELELNKHFRVHGMAFLMKRITPNK